jgi:hypothetical protein
MINYSCSIPDGGLWGEARAALERWCMHKKLRSVRSADELKRELVLFHVMPFKGNFFFFAFISNALDSSIHTLENHKKV